MRRWAGVALALLLAGCHLSPPRHPTGDVNPQAELARTLAAVRTATAEHPDTLKVLFYGQSITSPKWTNLAAAHLQAAYPNTHFIVRNMAIPGFPSQTLERTAERDLAEFYPDLIVFHVFGDHHAYERIIRTMRSTTAAEIIVQTDHVTQPVEPICDEGIHLTLHAPPGCKGFLRYKQNSWEDFMSGTWVPGLASRYGLAIEPRRWAWAAYLRRNHLPIASLLADPPHPNDRGWALMARFFDLWFDKLAANWTPHLQTLVQDRAVPAGDVATLDASGNRIELLAREALHEKLAVRIDGKSPQEIDGCWQISRASPLPVDEHWPTIRQIGAAPGIHRRESWTATITGLSPAQDDFHFHLVSSVSGDEGEGGARSDFVSRSGSIRIAAKDWAIADMARIIGRHIPEGFRVTWDRHFVCSDEPAVTLGQGQQEVRHVLATGLANGPHHVELRFAPGARLLVNGIRDYRPPLAD